VQIRWRQEEEGAAEQTERVYFQRRFLRPALLSRWQQPGLHLKVEETRPPAEEEVRV
jgi:hypothetical protein